MSLTLQPLVTFKQLWNDYGDVQGGGQPAAVSGAQTAAGKPARAKQVKLPKKAEKAASKKTSRANIDIYVNEQLEAGLQLLTDRLNTAAQGSITFPGKLLLRAIQKLCRLVNDLFLQAQRGRLERFIKYRTRDRTAK